jgi:hypothetical protein
MWYWISSSIYWLVKLFNGDWHNMTSNIHYALPNNMVNYTYHQSSYHIWKLSEQRPQRNCIHKVQLYWICMMTFKSYNSYKYHWIKMAWYNMINYTSWPIILPNMKVIGPTNAEELHSQSETGLFCIYTPDNQFRRPIVNQGRGLFWILSDSNVSLEEQIWLTECIYLADYFKFRKKKKKQNEMSFLITW